MTSQKHTILDIKRATVEIGGVEYGDAITSAAYNHASTKSTWAPISGNDQNSYPDPDETISLAFGQDLSSADTLHAKLLSAFNTVVPVVIRPAGGEHPSVTATVRVGPVVGNTAGGGRGVAVATCELSVEKVGGVGGVVRAADGSVVFPADADAVTEPAPEG